MLRGRCLDRSDCVCVGDEIRSDRNVRQDSLGYSRIYKVSSWNNIEYIRALVRWIMEIYNRLEPRYIYSECGGYTNNTDLDGIK